MLTRLFTPAGEALREDPQTQPWQAYPRPQMRRENWINLNGDWEFAVNGEAKGTIRVPFCPESALSGIEEHFPEGSTLRYRREFAFPEWAEPGRVLLHIGAADQTAEVWVNGSMLCRHKGGYEAFSVDVTELLQENNVLEICCTDDLTDQSYPYGKQTLKRGGMWYTPVSGIWQTVWLERVPEKYIKSLQIENRGREVTVHVMPELEGKVTVKGVGEFPLLEGRVTVTPEQPHLWSPEDPYLYEMTVEAGGDRVESYFALRVLETKEVDGVPRLCLNGEPYFFHGLLDQGYWPEGLLTPPAPESYEADILAVKKLGFNMLRKHIKVEPEQFYYDCDRLGVVVFQDMVNNGEYRFLRDTALPTAGFQKLKDKEMHRDEKCRRMFLAGMESTVKQLGNHPCVVYWTIFNEGWGQFAADETYERMLELDDTRWIDATSGWFRQKKSDVESLHCYFRKYRFRYDAKPVVLSEFGGFSHAVAEHVFNPDKSYGYGTCQTREALEQRVEELYREQILPAAEMGLCAAVYTQVSDVEDEINGLLTYDRRVEKLTAERMVPIAQALMAAVK